jgi:protein-tyrosine-phosphatase
MQVGFVCRMNQIRSPFAAAVVSSIFPEISVFSAGTDADANCSVHSRAISLGSQWGIALSKDPSAGIFARAESIQSADLVIAAEDELLPKILALPIRGKITSFNSVALAPEFFPIDPIGMSEQEFRVQMAKVAHLAIRGVFREVYGAQSKSISAVIPISENIFELALTSAVFEARARDAVLIYVDFRVYLPSIPWLSNIVRYNPQLSDPSFFLSNPRSSIFLPDRELSSPEKEFLSRRWIDLIFQIAKFSDVILLTSPRYLESGKTYDAILASCFAETVVVVNA